MRPSWRITGSSGMSPSEMRASAFEIGHISVGSNPPGMMLTLAGSPL
jgi:hypothetical protein